MVPSMVHCFSCGWRLHSTLCFLPLRLAVRFTHLGLRRAASLQDAGAGMDSDNTKEVQRDEEAMLKRLAAAPQTSESSGCAEVLLMNQHSLKKCCHDARDSSHNLQKGRQPASLIFTTKAWNLDQFIAQWTELPTLHVFRG